MVAQAWVICAPVPFTKAGVVVHLAEDRHNGGWKLMGWLGTITGPSGRYVDAQAAVWCKWINVFGYRHWRMTFWWTGREGSRIAEAGSYARQEQLRCSA